MHIASIIRADNSGLGTLAREFYDNGIINKVLIVPNGAYQIFPERFKNKKITKDFNDDDIEWLLKDTKCLLLFETPFRWDIIKIARNRGIKMILMPMHECLPEQIPHNPDLWLCPSTLDYELNVSPKILTQVPVNIDRIKWRLRKKANIFIHNAGHGGLNGRNGTKELLEAMKYVKSNIKLIIRSQMNVFKTDDKRIEFRFENLENYWNLWNEGDVFVFPEKFNGLSLPIQEAFASGMIVMTTEKKSFDWLPSKFLLKPREWQKIKISREVDNAIHNPIDIAKKIDEIAFTDISKYSLMGKEWGIKNSWKILKDDYLKIIDNICNMQ